MMIYCEDFILTAYIFTETLNSGVVFRGFKIYRMDSLVNIFRKMITSSLDVK